MRPTTAHILGLSEDLLPGGRADDVPDSEFDQRELAMGIKHEMEHTNDPEVAKEIAKDHLRENPHYYSDLNSAHIE